MKFDNIDRCLQLHESVEIISVVDSYEAQFTVQDGDYTVLTGVGVSVSAALEDLDRKLASHTIESVRAL